PVFSYPLSPFFFLASLPDHQPRDSRLFAMFPPVSQTDPDSVHRPRATLRAPQLSALQRFFAAASRVESPSAHARRAVWLTMNGERNGRGCRERPPAQPAAPPKKFGRALPELHCAEQQMVRPARARHLRVVAEPADPLSRAE